MTANDPTTAPLRDRKKAKQRADLLRIAADLFRRDGYEATRMEDIAEQASVSVPTVYNYFSSKRDVLVELLMEDRRDTQPAFEQVASNPPDDPADALAALIHANIASIQTPEDKRLWRDLIAAVAKAHDSERDQFEQNHEIFKDYIKRLLRHFVQQGRLLKTLPLALAADIVFAVNSSNLRHLVAAEDATPESIRALTRRQMKLLMAGWLEPEPPQAGSARQSRQRRGR